DVLVRDVEMGERAENGRMRRRREPDVLIAQALERLVSLEAERLEIDLDEVRLDLLELDPQARVAQALGQPSRPHMILRQAIDVVIERIDAGRGDDSRLAHRPAEEMLDAPRLHHPLFGAGDDRAERAPETLREAERDRVEVRSDSRGLLAGCDRR